MIIDSSTFPKRQLGANGPTVSAVGYGAMGIGDNMYGKSDEVEAFRTLTYAADRGITFWDTSDIYGASQEVLGKWFAQTGRRSEIFLATKFGAMDFSVPADAPERYRSNSKPAYIRRQLAASLATLQTDYVDLYYQHRVDPEVPIEVVLETLRPYVEAGTVRWIGLSECSAAVLRRARAVPGIGEKVVAAQMEFSPFELGIERSGFTDAAQKAGVGIVAYSPLGRGLITGRFRSPADFEKGDLRLLLPRFTEENFPKNLELVEQLKTVADKYGVTTAQISIAWILAENPTYIPIPGTRTVERLEELAKAAELKLAPEDVKELRRLVDSADVRGDNYPEQFKRSDTCIELSEWKGEQV